MSDSTPENTSERLVAIDDMIRRRFATKKAFAIAVGWEPSKVTKVVNGLQPWSDADIADTAKALNVSIFTVARMVKRAPYVVAEDDNAVAITCLAADNQLRGEHAENVWKIPNSVYRTFTDAPADQVAIMKVVGDAMAPVYSNGDHVLIDRSFRKPTAVADYVISTGVSLELKTIQILLGQSEPIVELRCYNPDYTPIQMALASVRIVGRIVGHLRPR